MYSLQLVVAVLFLAFVHSTPIPNNAVQPGHYGNIPTVKTLENDLSVLPEGSATPPTDLMAQEFFYPGYWGVRPWGMWGGYRPGWGGYRPGWYGWHGWYKPQWGGHWGGHWGG